MPGLQMRKDIMPDLWSANFIDIASTPRPYVTDRDKFIEDASSKYLVGQLISPIE
jgi:hypothetical protein